MNRWQDKALMATTGLLLIVGVITAILYFRAARDAAVAQAVADAKQQVIDAAEKRMADRDRELKQQLADLEKQKQEIRTAPQAVRVIERYLPQTVGQSAQLTPAQIPSDVKAKLPDSPGYTVMTDAAAVELGKEIVECQKTKAGLAACAGDKKDLDEQLKAAIAQRDSWEKVAKGGSKSRRILRGAAIAGCAAGGAAGGAQTSNPGKGAAIGALAGFVACTLIMK